MKPIINLEFTGRLPLDNCQMYYREIRDMLKDEDCYIIGTFKPDMEIKEICGENILLKFNAKDYTANEVIEALESYEKERNKC